MKFYLVDYENTHEAGLVGLNKLDANAEVHIFYSKNADKIVIKVFGLNKAGSLNEVDKPESFIKTVDW